MFDFLVVGLGIAGWSFVRLLREHRKNFMVIDSGDPGASRVSAGFYNPVILKRFTPAWKADAFLPYALLQYRKAEMDYGKKLVYPQKIYRKLASVEEQNNWHVASQRPVLKKYMREVVFENLPGIEAPFGYGVLENTGMVDLNALLEWERKLLKERNLLREEKFAYDALEIKGGYITYKDIRAQFVVFAEGFGMKENPFFKHLPMTGTKGEVLEVKPSKPVSVAVKSAIFLSPLPWKEDIHLVGATYNWQDKTPVPTPGARRQLTEKLESLYRLPYEIVSQWAGIRPTVKDRRPLVGRHGGFPALSVLNGMGTRGVIYAPRAAKYLFENLVLGVEIPREINIQRFKL